MEKTSQENVYLTLISECHEVINQISSKTMMLQSEVNSIREEKGQQYNSALDRELKQLLNHLQELRDNLVV